ncbi:non-heme iron oxygenase ferredoxin subunit [Paenarthrobacter sp. Z7-10]|uniref:non-heme iron oxygenase ferredoxin subunit n=1 Tax=Paenarthrobacter sp. Z7-10 TaxID=2787635 RepID=UPI0022A8E506|nr:non-heme iron oxygenase ferredoxin subunit [Paenarthrobacter sp. Z7-10]MCZ2402656.1 non-heme iron oxygenase ferredoxin subunit [Paenarthrobacter sp. Z7-10]
MSASAEPSGELVCRVEDVELKSALRIEIDDYPVAIVKDSEGTLHAIGDTCSHAEISLSEGDVEGSTIECWAHGSSFDLRTGEPLTLPAYEPVPVFALSIDAGNVYVDVTKILNGVHTPELEA